MTYANSVGRTAPSFTPYMIRRDGRLFLAVPDVSKGGVVTFELSPVQVAEMAVGLHVCMHAIACEARREASAKLPAVWSTQHAD